MKNKSSAPGALDIAKISPMVDDARFLPARDIPLEEWVREACNLCRTTVSLCYALLEPSALMS